MAKIQLIIEVDAPGDLQDILSDLAGYTTNFGALDRTPNAVTRAAIEAAERGETTRIESVAEIATEGGDQGETQRRRRRTKTEMEAERTSSPASPTSNTATASVPATGMTLADQIKEAVAEEPDASDLLADMLSGAAEELAPAYTPDDVRKVMAAAIGKFEPSPVGKRIAKITGGPVRIGDIPPDKFGAVIADLEAMLAGN